MTIKTHQLVFEISVKELDIWMCALRMAARQRGGTVPWDACGFLIQHGELVRLTGYGAGDHEDLKRRLNPSLKAEEVAGQGGGE